MRNVKTKIKQTNTLIWLLYDVVYNAYCCTLIKPLLGFKPQTIRLNLTVYKFNILISKRLPEKNLNIVTEILAILTILHIDY